jgi:hypothetical protein
MFAPPPWGEHRGMAERGSDKHGPRLDEQLEHELDGMLRGEGPTHAEEWRDPEPAGEDQPAVGGAEGRDGAAPPGMTGDEVELRSELAARLNRAAFPADAPALRDHLAAEHAPAELATLLTRLPSGRQYESVGEVWAALGFGKEDHRF